MGSEDLVAALDSVVDGAKEQFPDNARLGDLEAHVETCKMIVSHMADEVPVDNVVEEG